MSNPIRAEMSRLAVTPAGRALAAHHFAPMHQGGGLVNFERPGAGGRRLIVCSMAPSADGHGPEALEEPCEMVTVDEDGQDERWDEFDTVQALCDYLAASES